jgi:hypothetical protein
MKILLWFSAALAVLALCGCEIQEVTPAEMTSTTQSRPREGEERLSADVRFEIGTLELAADKASNLYSLDLEYDKAHYQPDVQYTTAAGGEGRLTVKLEGLHKFGVRNERRTNRLRLNLTDALPVEMNLRTGVGDARLSLSSLRLKRLEINSGVGSTRISAYEPNPETCERVRLRCGVGGLDATGLGNLNFRELDFEGGVGGANLDLTGEWRQDATMRIEVGIGGVTLRMPRDVGVRVDTEKHLLSGFHLDGFVKRDSEYYSENYDNAKIRVSIRVQTGIGGFKLSWI